MISPFAYLDSRKIRELDEEGVLKEIKKQRRRIKYLKDQLGYGAEYCVNVWTEDGLDMQLSWNRECLDIVRGVYFKRFGHDKEHYEKAFTRREIRDEDFQYNIDRILRITYTEKRIADGREQECEYIADFSVEPTVTFRIEKTSDGDTREEELFRTYQMQQDMTADMPRKEQLEHLRMLRNQMLQLRSAQPVRKDYSDDYNKRLFVFEDLAYIHVGEMNKEYRRYTANDFKKYSDRRIRLCKSYVRSLSREWDAYDLDANDFCHQETMNRENGDEIIGPDGLLSWKLRVDYRNDMQYIGRYELEEYREDEVPPFESCGANFAPYEIDDLSKLLHFGSYFNDQDCEIFHSDDFPWPDSSDDDDMEDDDGDDTDDRNDGDSDGDDTE